MTQDWFCNTETPLDAIAGAKRLNELAASGNNFMGCSFYEYYAGEPFVNHDNPAAGEMKRMGGIYRRLLEKCVYCGGPADKHQDANVFTLPCGGKVKYD